MKEYRRLIETGQGSAQKVTAENPLLKHTLQALKQHGAVREEPKPDGDVALFYHPVSQYKRVWESTPPQRTEPQRFEVDYENLTITGEERTIFTIDTSEGATQ